MDSVLNIKNAINYFLATLDLTVEKSHVIAIMHIGIKITTNQIMFVKLNVFN